MLPFPVLPSPGIALATLTLRAASQDRDEDSDHGGWMRDGSGQMGKTTQPILSTVGRQGVRQRREVTI